MLVCRHIASPLAIIVLFFILINMPLLIGSDSYCNHTYSIDWPAVQEGFNCSVEVNCSMNMDLPYFDIIEAQLLVCVNIDECLTDLCENGGTCTDTEGSYKCDCPCGWTGKNCQGMLQLQTVMAMLLVMVIGN